MSPQAASRVGVFFLVASVAAGSRRPGPRRSPSTRSPCPTTSA